MFAGKTVCRKDFSPYTVRGLSRRLVGSVALVAALMNVAVRRTQDTFASGVVSPGGRRNSTVPMPSSRRFVKFHEKYLSLSGLRQSIKASILPQELIVEKIFSVGRVLNTGWST